MAKPGITFIIQHPSPDLDNEAYEGNKFYTRGAVHDLSDARSFVPERVISFLKNSFEAGWYRAEILDGETLYKFYRKPSRDLVPKEEDGTPLEIFQRQGGAGSGPLFKGSDYGPIGEALAMVKPPEITERREDPVEYDSQS